MTNGSRSYPHAKNTVQVSDHDDTSDDESTCSDDSDGSTSADSSDSHATQDTDYGIGDECFIAAPHITEQYEDVDRDESARAQASLKELEKHGRHLPQLGDTTVRSIAYIESRWRKYCRLVGLEGCWKRQLLKARPHVYKGFLKELDWSCRKAASDPMKHGRRQGLSRSTLLQYFKVLKQLYRREKRKKLKKSVAKDVKQYIISYTQGREEETAFAAKPVFTGRDFRQALHFLYKNHSAWFRTGRELVALAFLIIIHAYTGLRPGSTMKTSKESVKPPPKLRYSNFKLYVVRDETNRSRFVVEAIFDNFKGQRSQRKLFRWFDQSDPFICPVMHLLALAMHDKAFEDERLNDPANLFKLQVPDGDVILPIAFRTSCLDLHVFRNRNGLEVSDNATRKRLQQLMLSMGVLNPEVTFYCFRRAILNQIDDRVSDAVRRQVAGHMSDSIFGQYYIDQCINVDLAALLNGKPGEDHMIAIMGDLTLGADPQANQALTRQELDKIAAEPTVKSLDDRCTLLFERIRSQYKFINKAPESDPILMKYKACRRQLRALKAARSQQVMRTKREEFFANKARASIDAQLNGTGKSSIIPSPEIIRKVVLTFQERYHFAKLPLDIDMLAEDCADDRTILLQRLVIMCYREEGPRGRPTDSTAVQHTTSATPGMAQEPSAVAKVVVMEIGELQCLFCIGAEKPKTKFGRKQSLWEHVRTQHLRNLNIEEGIICPHPLCSHKQEVLDNVCHLFNHAAREHGVRLQKG